MIHITKLWYLTTILFFTGLAAYLIWYERKRLFKKHWKFIVVFVLLATPFGYWDAVALRWSAYAYNPAHTLYFRVFGGEIETYLFLSLVTAIVCSATVIYLQEEERNALRLRRRSRKRRRQKSKPRKQR